MPRRKAKGINPAHLTPEQDSVVISRAIFQILHNTARSVFRNAASEDNHSPQTLVYLQTLDAAIDEGHRVLGTQRSYADQYINIISGLTQVQMENAEAILRSEGLLTDT